MKIVNSATSGNAWLKTAAHYPSRLSTGKRIAPQPSTGCRGHSPPQTRRGSLPRRGESNCLLLVSKNFYQGPESAVKRSEPRVGTCLNSLAHPVKGTLTNSRPLEPLLRLCACAQSVLEGVTKSLTTVGSNPSGVRPREVLSSHREEQGKKRICANARVWVRAQSAVSPLRARKRRKWTIWLTPKLPFVAGAEAHCNYYQVAKQPGFIGE